MADAPPACLQLVRTGRVAQASKAICRHGFKPLRDVRFRKPSTKERRPKGRTPEYQVLATDRHRTRLLSGCFAQMPLRSVNSCFSSLPTGFRRVQA